MSELTLENLAWTIPGICFLFSYNRLRDAESLEFSGWPFVFFIVLIGSFTVLPLKYWFNISSYTTIIFIASTVSFLIPFVIKYCFAPFVEKLENEPNFFIPSNLWSVVYFFFPLENRDKFIKNCIDCEGEPVLITTEEDLIIFSDDQPDKKLPCCVVKSALFFGILIEFPYVAAQVVDSQAVRILPIFSGYKYLDRKDQKEKIQWVRKYDITEDSFGIVIPRNRILSFSKYTEEDEKTVFYNDAS